jgi:phosphosulfolactate synthase (CoM biosynthesis protein A)
MHQHYVMTMDPRYVEVLEWIVLRKLESTVHLNRTRFYVPSGSVYTEFILRFGECCPLVNPNADLVTGLAP